MYNYPPLNASQYYLPPRVDHSGDLDCDCNTVMYKYEVQAPQRGSCADLPFGLKSLHGMRIVSAGPDLLVRPQAVIPLRCLLTTPFRWTAWIAACQSVYVSQSVPLPSATSVSHFRRSLICSGTQSPSRKELPFRAGLSSTSR